MSHKFIARHFIFYFSFAIRELVLGHHAILKEERHEMLKEKAIQAQKDQLLCGENLTPRSKEKSGSEISLVRNRSKTHSYSRPESARTNSSQSLLQRPKSSKMLEIKEVVGSKNT